MSDLNDNIQIHCAKKLLAGKIQQTSSIFDELQSNIKLQLLLQLFTCKKILIYRRVSHLIRQHSSPLNSWTRLPGSVKREFETYAEAERYLTKKSGDIRQ